MRPSKRMLIVVLLLVLPLIAPSVRGRPQAEKKQDDHPSAPSDKASRKPTAGDKRTAALMEAQFRDESKLRLTLREEHIEFHTRYGKLVIPVRDIQRIEVGFRVPEDVARRIDAAIADLGKAEFEKREAASAELLELRTYSYPAIEKAAKSSDAEVVRRARELLEKIRDEVPEEQLVFHPHDVIYTADSMNTGRLGSATIKVLTSQFGEQQLKLSDVRQLRSPSAIESEPADVMADPGHLSSLLGQLGKVYHFRVTGNAGPGFIYGSDVYTLDSSLAIAAVHAGVLKTGQTGVVRVKILGAQPAYASTTRHGVTSQAYGAYHGSFQFVRVRGRAN